MKTNITFSVFLFSFIFTLFSCFPSLGKVKKTQYQRKANLAIENPNPKTAYKAEIPLDLLEGSIDGDLRIVDKNNKELPFVFESASDDWTSEAKSLKIYNQSVLENKEQSLELDLKDAPELNELELDIKDTNFDRSVSVYGRDNKSDDWKLIKKDLKIIASQLPDQKIDFKHTSLKFPETRYKFLKLKITLNNPEKNSVKPLEILSVKSRFIKKSLDHVFNSIDLPLRELFITKQNKKSSLWILDTQDKDYNFEKINLEFSENSFSRDTLLYCSAKPKPTFLDDPEISLITSTNLYKFKDIQNLSIIGLSGKCRYFIVEILQGDNLPIKPYKAKGEIRRKFLKFIFEPPFELPLTIYAKSTSKDLEFPSYDLEVRIAKEKINNFQVARINEVSPNPEFQGQSISKENKYEALIPYAGAVFLIAFVTFYIFSLAKKNNFNS
ncbi:MAG: hypothetical protein SFU25_02815 [Candidatus Caenarcaniphilales bacterium]|nr:hypothetical protein [Candidatus Caenarcaniphilales bacterium]